MTLALAQAGRTPLVVTGDGADGYPPGAPYDRVISTYAWWQHAGQPHRDRYG